MKTAAPLGAAPQESPETRAANVLLITAALGLCALRLTVAASTGLADDEAYYRIWSLAPALSYFDHPPMVAWMMAAGRFLVGDTALGVRFLAPFAHLVGTALLWRTASLLYGAEVARRAVWVFLAMPLAAVGGVIMTPDMPSVLFSGLVLWSLAELDRSKNANWWLAVGFFAGLGLLSKYTNLFLGATILIWLVAVPGNLRWFRSLKLWAGGVLAMIVASPVVIWNAEHGWVSFSKQFGRVARNGSAGAAYLAEFIGGFLALASPLIAIFAIAGLIHVVRAAIANRKSRDVLLSAATLPMLLYFLIHALHDRVQGNWPGPVYPALAICAGIGLGTLFSERHRKPAFRAALAIGFLMVTAIYVHAVTPVLPAAVRKDPTEQMRGWQAFADAVDQQRKQAGAAWVATSSYATTGQLAFALRDRTTVAQLDERIRYLFLPPPPAELLQKPTLYVELERRADRTLLRNKFRNVVSLGTLKRDNGIVGGATYAVFLASDPPEPPL